MIFLFVWRSSHGECVQCSVGRDRRGCCRRPSCQGARSPTGANSRRTVDLRSPLTDGAGPARDLIGIVGNRYSEGSPDGLPQASVSRCILNDEVSVVSRSSENADDRNQTHTHAAERNRHPAKPCTWARIAPSRPTVFHARRERPGDTCFLNGRVRDRLRGGRRGTTQPMTDVPAVPAAAIRIMQSQGLIITGHRPSANGASSHVI